LYFNGINAYVEVPHSDSLNLNELTIIAWIKPMVDGFFWFVAKADPFISGTPGFICIRDYANHLSFYMSDGENGGWIYTNAVLTTGLWWNVAIANNTTTVKLYINGELDREGDAKTSSIAPTTVPLYIGRDIYPDYSNGHIAQVLAYNKTLSQVEIKQSVNNPLNPAKQEYLVLWLDWTSIDIANGLWLDRSGNDNDGVIHGATEETIIKSKARSLSVARSLYPFR